MKKKLKLIILTCAQSAQRINYYNELGKLCQLTVITERKTPENIYVEYNVEPQTYCSIYLKGMPMFGYMALCPEVIGVLKKKAYDMVIVEQYATPTSAIAINYLHKQGIPFIISADGGFPDDEENRVKYLFKKSLISKASLWITSGRFGAKYLEFYGADINKIKIFKFSPYSKDDQPLDMTKNEEKMKFKKKYGINEKVVIMSVGQQIHRKGFDLLIEAAKDIKNDVGIYILGGNPNEECTKLLSEFSGKNIHFPGKVSKNILKEYYRLTDIFVFPTRYDIWGYPINEAMTFGLPIITTTRCNAGLELIENGVNGYLVETENVRELTSSMLNLIENEQLRFDMGQRNFIKSKEYNSESMAKSIFSIINDFLSEDNCYMV